MDTTRLLHLKWRRDDRDMDKDMGHYVVSDGNTDQAAWPSPPRHVTPMGHENGKEEDGDAATAEARGTGTNTAEGHSVFMALALQQAALLIALTTPTNRLVGGCSYQLVYRRQAPCNSCTLRWDGNPWRTS